MAAGLLDTSVVIDWHDLSIADTLSEDFGISAITAAELTAGPLLSTTPAEAARRQRPGPLQPQPGRLPGLGGPDSRRCGVRIPRSAANGGW